MAANAQSTPALDKTIWAGRVLSGLVVIFLLMDSGMKLMRLPIVLETQAQLGYSGSVTLPLGVILLACTILYAVPKTAVLGAILLTAYLGGAVATHVRIGSPLLSHTLFGVYLGAMLWGGLYLREARLRDLVPLRR